MGHTCQMENAGVRRHRLEEPAAACAGRRNSDHALEAANRAARVTRAAVDHDSFP
ncbi:hypothetical protein [Burkholderia cepacia]|uniref:hypothetical protein n=1 Tax=Burkholderia cepacia TaxID=292 RepID=UPI0003FAF30B|nr:hypothetical protein [Burkholderia cepacia]